jgi:FdhD protein
MNDSIFEVLRYDDGERSIGPDELTAEEPLEIRVRGRAISVTMRTPGHDAELASGFLLSEGIVKTSSDIVQVAHCDRNDDGNVINVQLAPDVAVDLDRLTRHVFASSSCGLCGKATIEAIRASLPPIGADDVRIDAQALCQMPAAMRCAQTAFARTGGTHAAALFDASSGTMLVLREDVGRHNAVDKVIGYAMLNNMTPLNRHVLLVSGRSSFEIVQKALAARIPLIAAVSAPSSLAVEFARASGQTLVGFLRGQRMNVYAGAQRIRFEQESIATLTQPSAGMQENVVHLR